MNKKTKLKKEADKLWRQAVFILNGNICKACNKEAVDQHHFFQRSRYSIIEYDVSNGVPLCRDCHAKIHFGNKLQKESVNAKIISTNGLFWHDALKKKTLQNKGSFKTEKYYLNAIDKLLKIN